MGRDPPSLGRHPFPHLAAHLRSLELQIPGAPAAQTGSVLFACGYGEGRWPGGGRFKPGRRNMEGRGAGPGRAVCECQKGPRRAQQWCCSSGTWWSWERVGRGRGRGAVRPGKTGLCWVGWERSVRTRAGGGKAVSCLRNAPTSVPHFRAYKELFPLSPDSGAP